MSPAPELKMAAELEALRRNAAWNAPAHVHCLRLSGAGAFAALDGLCAAQLYLRAHGAAFALAPVGLAALDQCALENGFFNIRAEGRAGLTPLELQLQWRVSYKKDYVGSQALLARREAGCARRVTWALGPPETALAAGDAVYLDEQRIGSLVNAGYVVPCGVYAALALLERPYACAGISGFTVETAAGRVPIRTVSPPLLNNRSVYVNPQHHRYATRHELALPRLARY